MRAATFTFVSLVVTLLASCGEIDPGRSTLKVDSTPPSEVWLNGESAGTTPLVLRLQPGDYEVVFKLPGFEDHENRIPVPAGAEVELTVPLVAKDLLFALQKVATDLQAFFAELGQQPPGAFLEVRKVADAGQVPTRGPDREALAGMLTGLADSIEQLEIDAALVERMRALAERLE